MDVATALGTYLEIVDSVAPGMVEGLYVVGSFALDDWQPGRSDIDIVAVLAEPATDDDFGSLRTAHALLNERQPLPHIDGPYLAWADLIAAPATGLHRPWTLAGELHHDGECFEINPVTWYTLATYGVTVRGPAVDTLNIWHETEASRPLRDRQPRRRTGPRSPTRSRRHATTRARRSTWPRSNGARSARCGCTTRRSPVTSPRSAVPGSTGSS